MIQTYSSTIRRKEMDAVLTCMVDEKIGPGELNTKLIQGMKEFNSCEGASALRSPSIALKYIVRALGLEKGDKVIISALSPKWHYYGLLDLGLEPIVLDVNDETGFIDEENLLEGAKLGAKLVILYEHDGILPDFEVYKRVGIPFIEDISKSAGASNPVLDENGNETDKRQKAGSYGVFSILGMEEHDIITAGGGAVLLASSRREWLILKQYLENIPSVDLLPDINAALGLVQLKEFARNEKSRKDIFKLYQQSCLIGKHKTFPRTLDDSTTVSDFALIIASSFNDVKQYAAKKDIEVALAFTDAVVNISEEIQEKAPHSKSLALRCVNFPLYSRLTHSEIEKVVKVLGSLP